MKRQKRGIALITVIVLAIGLFMSQATVVSAASLSDTTNHWAEETIEKFVSKGYAEGYADGSFRPDKEITRAEFVVIVNKVFLIPNSDKGANFYDVTPADWFYSDVMSASADGYIRGYDDNTFRPNNLITRQEACAIIYRLLSLPPTSDDSQLSEFSDASTIAAWSKNSVTSLISEGIINGYADKTLKPNGKLTRAEALCLIDRAVAVTIPSINITNHIEGSAGINGNNVLIIYGTTLILRPTVTTKARGTVDYFWEITGQEAGGRIVNGNNGPILEMIAPFDFGDYFISLVVTNSIGISDSAGIKLTVTDLPGSGFPPLPDDYDSGSSSAGDEYLLVPDGRGGFSIEKENSGVRFLQNGTSDIMYFLPIAL